MLQHIRCTAIRGGATALRPGPTTMSRRCLHPSRLTNASTTAGENAYRRREFVPTQSRSCALGSVATAVIGCACLAATMSSNAKAVVAEKSSLGGTEHRENVAAVSLEEDENEALVAAAHELRRSLVPPHQSLFRVVCILVYEDIAGKFHRITGTNAEPSTIGGSICAERAAMCKLREVRDLKLVTKVIVVTDNLGPLAPGVLCREFLSTHLPPSTPVVMSGSGDVEQSTAGGFLYAENDTCPSAPTTIRTKADAASSTSIASRGVEGNSTNSTCEYRPATFRTESHASKAETGTTAIGEGHEGGNGGSEGRWKSHIDTCTVDQLYPWRNTYGVTSRGEQVKAGFLKQEVAEDLSQPGLLARLGLKGAVLQAYNSAWRATAEDDRDGVHPIRYAAAALFSDGTVEVTHQLKALEYGATLDPVTLLAPAMVKLSKNGHRPLCILLVDQFGNLHAPFAQARTFLSEHGFGDVKVVMHTDDGKLVVVKVEEALSSPGTRRLLPRGGGGHQKGASRNRGGDVDELSSSWGTIQCWAQASACSALVRKVGMDLKASVPQVALQETPVARLPHRDQP